jgi:hypothetical protein
MLTPPGIAAPTNRFSFLTNTLGELRSAARYPRYQKLVLALLTATVTVIMAACGSAASKDSPKSAAPVIATFAPSSGTVGTIVVLQGANFASATSVKFNGAAASFSAGTGFIGKVHARSARLAGAELVGVAASSPESARAAASELGADRPFDSAEEMVRDPAVDVVHICTPNHLHLPLAEAALARAGLPLEQRSI